MTMTAATESTTTGTWTVLCVDDEANILAALKRVLRRAGYDVLSAGDGLQALSCLDETCVDIVISDMRMPGMDGVALLEQVRQRWPGIARILLTGQADTASSVAAVNRGRVARFLQKPWDERELLDALAESVERITLERERDRLHKLTCTQNEKTRWRRSSSRPCCTTSG
jgi:DNA-binding NtrC family response regulator